MSRNHGLYAALFTVALLVQALPNAADAAPVPNGNVTALRAAITNAAPGDTIVLAANGTYTLDGTELEIVKKLTINGRGATISGNAASRVIYVENTGNLTLRDVIITGGSAEEGGGIFNSGGTVTLKDKSSVTGNTASGSGGGINNEYGTVTLKDKSSVSGNTANVGGGIFNYEDGTVTLSDTSRVSGNTADNGSGGIYNSLGGTVTLKDKSSVSGNTANVSGGILNDGGTVTLKDTSSVSGNTAYDGGGIYNTNGTVTLSDKSSVSGNTAAGNGGGIYNGGTLNNANAGGNVRNNQPDQIYNYP